MPDYMKINTDELVPLHSVRRISAITDKDRESLAKLGDHVDAERFAMRIDYANGKKGYAPETAEDIRAQGVELLEIADDSFIPAANIVKARNLTAADRSDFEQKLGWAMRADFRSQVETRAGMVLATVDAAAVMNRLSHLSQ